MKSINKSWNDIRKRSLEEGIADSWEVLINLHESNPNKAVVREIFSYQQKEYREITGHFYLPYKQQQNAREN